MLQEYGSQGLAAVNQGVAVAKSQLPVVKRKAAELGTWLGDSVSQLIEGKVDWNKVTQRIDKKCNFKS